jgi:hypothetical protein
MRVYTYSQVSVVFRVSKSFSSFSFRCYHEFQLKSTWVSKFLSFLSFHGFLRFYVVFCGFLGHKTEKNSISQLLMSRRSTFHHFTVTVPPKMPPSQLCLVHHSTVSVLQKLFLSRKGQ